MEIEKDKLYTVEETAGILRKTPETVRDYYIKKGKLTAKKAGGSWLVLGQDILGFLGEDEHKPDGDIPPREDDFEGRKKRAEKEIEAIQAETRLKEARGERGKPEVLAEREKSLGEREVKLAEGSEDLGQREQIFQDLVTQKTAEFEEKAQELAEIQKRQEEIRKAQEVDRATILKAQQDVLLARAKLEEDKGKLITDKEKALQEMGAREKKLVDDKVNLEYNIKRREEDLRIRIGDFNDICYRLASQARGWGWESVARYLERLPLNWR